METFSSSLFHRDPKFGPFAARPNFHYFPHSSTSKLPSDDLLPELWLTDSSEKGLTSPALQYRAPGYVSAHYDVSPSERPSGSPDSGHLAYHPSEPMDSSYSTYGSAQDFRSPRSLQEYYYQNTYTPELTTGSQKLQSSLLLREQSLEYAQSLLPHSLLPLTEDNLDRNHKLNPTVNDTIYKRTNSLGRQNSRNESVSSRSSSSSNSSKNQKHLNTQLYKTELCASFIKSGACLYGQKCQFAHGKEELKEVDRPSNWRSKPCANWTQFGSCRYGKRCCFKHE